MCRFASAIYHRTAGLVYYQGVDSHTEIARRAGLRDQQNEFREMPYVRLEFVPSQGGGNFEAMGPWCRIVDEKTMPEWFTESMKETAFSILEAKVREWIVPEEGAVYNTDGWRGFYDGDGERHRDGGLPAVERPNGYKEYWVHGKLHRDGGLPAVEYPNGTKEYWVYGKWHRDGGLPAVERPDGYKSYWVHGKLHRDGGLPAVEYPNGTKEYWVHGKYIRTEYPNQAKEQ